MMFLELSPFRFQSLVGSLLVPVTKWHAATPWAVMPAYTIHVIGVTGGRPGDLRLATPPVAVSVQYAWRTALRVVL